jgi:hypothetical protein
MLSASIIHFYRRISDADILLNFRLQMFSLRPKLRQRSGFFFSDGGMMVQNGKPLRLPWVSHLPVMR